MWKNELHDSVRTISELKSLGYVADGELDELERVAGEFPMMIPRYYLSLIDRDDPDARIEDR